MLPRVKICCIANREEAQLAIAQGASALGLVSAMPSGPGVISEERIAEITAEIPPPIATFLLTSQPEAAQIIAQHRRCHTTALQLVDSLHPSVYPQLRAELPSVKLVQVIHVLGEESVREAEEVARWVDALLLDSGNPNLAIKELGGTGRRHNWSLSRQIVERVPKPVFLAGGLSPENVVEAIQQVRPFGLDICSGVRTNGRLDPLKLAAFMQAIHRQVRFSD